MKVLYLGPSHSEVGRSQDIAGSGPVGPLVTGVDFDWAAEVTVVVACAAAVVWTGGCT